MDNPTRQLTARQELCDHICHTFCDPFEKPCYDERGNINNAGCKLIAKVEEMIRKIQEGK